MSDTKVGSLITESAQRDAIHIAIAPVVSGGNYRPGEHVGFMPGGRIGTRCETKIGIIDPFLSDGVSVGQRCYVFLYPQTITGMRHHWSHPAFESNEQALNDKLSASDSEVWLRKYAVENNSYDTPQEAFERLIVGLKTGTIYFRGSDLHGLCDLPQPETLRIHAERFLGTKINWDNYIFTCSC